MDKVAIVCALILLGLFVVFVINNNVTPKPAAQEALFSLPSQAPLQNQTVSITPSSTQDNISNTTTAVIKTQRGDKILGITLQ